VRVPDQVLERMRRADSAEAAAAQGIAIARETVNAIRTMVQGVHIAAPAWRIDAALAVLDGIAASA
jgi:5,10-methylenetetrahydrofolate reductase